MFSFSVMGDVMSGIVWDARIREIIFKIYIIEMFEKAGREKRVDS